MRPLWVLPLLFIGALAGCAEDAAPVEEPASETHQDAPRVALPEQVTVVNSTDQDAPATVFSISAEAPVAGYVLEVPQDAAIPFVDGSSFEMTVMVMEPVNPENVTGMVIAFYDLESGGLLYAAVQVPGQVTSWLTAALPSTDTLGGPARTIFGVGDDVAGHSLGVVVAGQGVKGDAGLALRFAETTFVDADGELPSLDAVLADGAVRPTAIGTGKGVAANGYVELYIGLLGTPGIIGMEAVYGDPTVEDRSPVDLRPHPGLRDVTVRTEDPFGTGWSYSTTTTLSLGEGATLWALEVTGGNASTADDGIYTYGNGYGFVASALTFGLPIAAATGEGGGHAQVEYQSVESNQYFLEQTLTIAYDAPLEHLIGVRAPEMADSFDGLLTFDEAGTLRTTAGPATIEMPFPTPTP